MMFYHAVDQVLRGRYMALRESYQNMKRSYQALLCHTMHSDGPTRLSGGLMSGI